jgi:hypothetical protein
VAAPAVDVSETEESRPQKDISRAQVSDTEDDSGVPPDADAGEETKQRRKSPRKPKGQASSRRGKKKSDRPAGETTD